VYGSNICGLCKPKRFTGTTYAVYVHQNRLRIPHVRFLWPHQGPRRPLWFTCDTYRVYVNVQGLREAMFVVRVDHVGLRVRIFAGSRKPRGFP
jgi:hypothetical protein